MSISFQLIELPEEEQVPSRQMSLPATGGTIGRSFECSIQLPDFGRTLSRIHAEVLPHPSGGFQIVDRSTNGVFINDIRLMKEGSHQLSDGDSIRIGAYILLFSDMNALFTKKDQLNADRLEQEEQASESPFDQSAILDHSADSILGVDEWLSDAKPPSDKDEQPVFSSSNVTSEDLYGYDPFEDEEHPQMDYEGIEEEIVMLDKSSQPEHSNSLPVANSTQLTQLESSIEQLNRIIEQQRQTILASVDQDRLVACLETTLDRFMEELDPEQLEDEFDDYITGWGRKDRKYWALYRKQFQRKKERGDFYRKFSALLFEELRGPR